MERLLWTPDEIAEQRIIPYCAEEIRRMVRRGEIPAVRRRGRRILIHHEDLKAYADRFRLGHTDPVAGPHASKKGENVCREDKRKVSTKGRTRRTGGRPTPTDAESELGSLLGFQ
ncbi:helix-turn-helix domain-containing protein [Halomonas sp.]|tara:strand:+ start:8478 stop:8822 length:345 start_codon:yes stop_codon:yes gene_type:complete